MAINSQTKNSKKSMNVAIIMDGNGRWAISNSLNISKGHKKGVEIVRKIVEESVRQNISSLTLYAFSSENWSRPKAEIEAIKKLVIDAINNQVPELIEQKVKLRFFGHVNKFGKKIVSKIEEAENATYTDEGSLNLNVALGYGGRQDFLDITKDIATRVLSNEIKIDDIDEDTISQFDGKNFSEFKEKLSDIMVEKIDMSNEIVLPKIDTPGK